MEQKITIEKQKELKNESMFNFKNVSLMKKQLFSLMMAFALVLGLSVSAFAQYGIGTIDDPVTHVTGSTHSYTITTDGGDDITWTIHDAADDSDPTDDYENVTGADGLSFEFTWTDEASGSYYIQVVDQDADGCNTTRRFYVNVFTFDVWVYASTSDGTPLVDFENCGDNNADPTYIFDNELAGADVTDADGNGTLGNVIGNIGSTRWISFRITFDSELDDTPDYESIGFNYTVTANRTNGTTDATSDLQDFNGEGTAATGTTIIDGNTATLTTTIEWNDRWGSANDIIYSLTANNVTLYGEAGGAGTVLGVERLNLVGDQGDRAGGTPDRDANESDDVTIYAAPATSTIVVN